MKKRPFLRDNIVFMGGTAMSGFLGYFFHFVVSRKLSVGQYGELQAIVSLMMIFGVLSSALSYFAIKNSSVFAAHEDRRGQAHFLSFLIQKSKFPILGIFAFYILLLPLLKSLLHLTDYIGLLAVGISILFFLLSVFYINSLQGWKKFLAVGLIATAAAAVKLAGGYILASAYPTASLVSFSILISAILGWFIARYLSRKEWPASGFSSAEENSWREKYFSGESFKKSLISILFFSLALSIAGNLDIILVKNLTSSQTAGYYGALSVLGKIILWLNLSIVGVMFPEACSDGHFGRPAKLKSILGSYELIFLVSFPALLIYYFFPALLVSLLFGQKYILVSGYLWLFGLAALLLSFLTLEANLALARREKKATYILSAVVLILASGIFLFHADIKQVVLSASLSFFIGWLLILALNLKHRFSFSKTSFGNRKN
jgi:O-antigen/teichoic acid export membrane protein